MQESRRRKLQRRRGQTRHELQSGDLLSGVSHAAALRNRSARLENANSTDRQFDGS